MFYINVNVCVFMLILLTHTDGSKSERKKTTRADPSPLSTSRPTTTVKSEKDVSIKTKIKEEVEEWPIREMIAILGRENIKKSRKYSKVEYKATFK